MNIRVMNNQMLIVTIVIAVAVLVLVAGLWTAVHYYRRRLDDSLRTLCRFIYENILLHDELESKEKQQQTI